MFEDEGILDAGFSGLADDATASAGTSSKRLMKQAKRVLRNESEGLEYNNCVWKIVYGRVMRSGDDGNTFHNMRGYSQDWFYEELKKAKDRKQEEIAEIYFTPAQSRILDYINADESGVIEKSHIVKELTITIQTVATLINILTDKGVLIKTHQSRLQTYSKSDSFSELYKRRQVSAKENEEKKKGYLNKKEVLTLIRDANSESITVLEIANQTSIREEGVRQYLDRLCLTGYLRKKKDGARVTLLKRADRLAELYAENGL